MVCPDDPTAETPLPATSKRNETLHNYRRVISTRDKLVENVYLTPYLLTDCQLDPDA